jgi:hypothetical protein
LSPDAGLIQQVDSVLPRRVPRLGFRPRASDELVESFVHDVLFVLLIIGVFALLALIVKGVERL